MLSSWAKLAFSGMGVLIALACQGCSKSAPPVPSEDELNSILHMEGRGAEIDTGNCRDLDPNPLYCKTWASQGYCNYYRYADFMKANCRKSCSLCPPGSGTGGSTSAGTSSGGSGSGTDGSSMSVGTSLGSCPSPPECISGGYSSGRPAQTKWDIKSGCWWETCVKDVDVTAEKNDFVPNNVAKAEEILIRIYDKVYPFGSWLFRNVKTMTGSNDCSDKFKKWMVTKTPGALKSWKAFIDNMPLTIHETIHCMHANNGIFIPDIMQTLKFPIDECSRGICNVSPYDKEFPKRSEIWSRFPSSVRSDNLYGFYFKPERMGNQRLRGLLTETEAYLHDSPSGSWLNDGVGDSISVKPKWNANLIDSGNPYMLAYWSFANVLYLQRIKSNYPQTWNKMKQKGDSYHAKVGKLFLAHYDRFNFLLSLYVDKNKVSTVHKRHLLNTLRSEKVKVLKVDNAVEELRSALS